MPKDWRRLASIQTVQHEAFDLQDGGLYDPANNSPHQRGGIRGFIVRDGVLWPGVGAIRTGSRTLIAETFFDETSRRLALERGHAGKFPTVRTEGAAATLGHLYRNYYHRWADSIPRIYSLHHPALRALETVILYVDDRFSDEEMRVIRHLVPDNVTVAQVEPTTRVRADLCVHLPFLSTDRVDHSKWFTASAGFLPAECLDWLREQVYALFGLNPEEPFRKLYVTRRNAKVRRFLNEEEVAGYLRERGFEVVALETLPLQEQVRRFAEAEVVVAQHGAGLVNLLFAQAPRVLEVCSDADRQIFFRLISKARGFPHLQIHRDGTDKNADVELPIAELEDGLTKLKEESRASLQGIG
jgi:capsular polysaccharide biosynthesis protein